MQGLLGSSYSASTHALMYVKTYPSTRVGTGSGHPGYPDQPGHILSGLSRSDPVYKIPGCDADFALDHVR